jgi:hypothetical protein
VTESSLLKVQVFDDKKFRKKHAVLELPQPLGEMTIRAEVFWNTSRWQLKDGIHSFSPLWLNPESIKGSLGKLCGTLRLIITCLQVGV